jgi:hypothetical protein
MIGVARLWDESWQAFLVSAGALAFVGYFYLAKAETQHEAQRKAEFTPKAAEEIVKQYGAALARGCPDGGIARYDSYLPCSKEKIKQAYKLALAYQIEHESLTKETAELLLGAVTTLNAFVPEEKANRINNNKHSIGNDECWEFMRNMSGLEIWSEMNEFIADVQVLDRQDHLFHQRVHTLIGLEYSPGIEKRYWDDFP